MTAPNTPRTAEANDAAAHAAWDVDRAHAAERWSPCCDARLDARVPEIQRKCPVCGEPVLPEEAIRW